MFTTTPFTEIPFTGALNGRIAVVSGRVVGWWGHLGVESGEESLPCPEAEMWGHHKTDILGSTGTPDGNRSTPKQPRDFILRGFKLA
jgi:hypothetical protein